MLKKVCKYYHNKYHYGKWYEIALLKIFESLFGFAIAGLVILLPLFLILRNFI